MEQTLQTTLQASLLNRRWFQHKNIQITKLAIYDYYQVDQAHQMALLQVNEQFLYMILLQNQLLIEDNQIEINILEKFLNQLNQTPQLKLKTQKGFIQANNYSGNFQACGEVKTLSHGSTNSLFSLNNSSVLKLIRRPENGDHPEDKLLFLLNDWEHTPKILSNLSWQLAQEKMVFALNLQKLASQESFWDWLVNNLQELNSKNCGQTLLDTLTSSVEAVGSLLADFHNHIFDLSEGNNTQNSLPLSDFIQADFNNLLEQIQTLNYHNFALEPFIQKQINQADFWGIKFKQHGDFHLGQILRTAHGYQIIDLEGQPVNSLAQRWQPASPLQDVCGILRSLDYAIQINSTNLVGQNLKSNLQQSFLSAYLHGAQFPLPKPLEPVLQIHLLFKALEELDYENRARPEYSWIPKKAIEEMLE